MRRHVIGVVDLAQCGSNSNPQSHNNARTIYTFFHNGVIVELPTRWVRSISFEPRYSPLTVNQYAHNLKDFLSWLCESERYLGLALDDVLVAVNRRDLQDWILKRKATRIQANTLRNREIAVKLFVEWLTTLEPAELERSKTHLTRRRSLSRLLALGDCRDTYLLSWQLSCYVVSIMKVSAALLIHCTIPAFAYPKRNECNYVIYRTLGISQRE
jgi:hypothetical protein